MSGTTPSQRVAANVRRLREDRGWTRAGFRGRMGWTQAEASGAEWGRRQFTVDELVTLAGLFGVGVEDLLAPPQARHEAREAGGGN